MISVSSTPLFALRSILFVPAHRMDLVAKAAAGDAHAVCLDLEDGVSHDAKSAARLALKDGTAAIKAGGKRVFVRVNNDGDMVADDLTASASRCDAIVLPKAATPIQCGELRQRLMEHGATVDLPIIAQIETAAGLFSFCQNDIGRLGQTVQALAIGTEDLALDLNCKPDASPIRTGFDMLALASCASKLPLFGFPGSISDFTDLARFQSDVALGKAAGAVGTFCIHPKQVGVINQLFMPTQEEIATAQAIVETFENAAAAGVGAVKLNGQMIDLPIYLRAKSTLKHR